MRNPQLDVLYEDNHLLVVNKPAGLATMGTAAGQESLWTLAKQYVKRKYNKPGNVYLGVVSRLDAPVTGAVVLARTSKAARRLTEQFRAGEVEKVYWALVERAIEPPEGQCVNWLAKDEAAGRMRAVGPKTPGAREARLAYRRLRTLDGVCLIEVRLETGRKHQIRVQLAERGHPVLGDMKYGSHRAFPAGIALHARRLALLHPVGRQRLEIEAPLPASWQRWGEP